MSGLKNFCVFIYLFSFVAAYGMDIQNQNPELLSPEQPRVIISMGSSFSGSDQARKKLNSAEDIEEVIKVKSSRLPKKKIRVTGIPTSNVDDVFKQYTPRERNIINQSKDKYKLTDDKLQLLLQLKDEYELNDEGLLAIMKKNMNADGHPTKAWEMEQLKAKMEKDNTLREALQMKAFIKMIDELERKQEAPVTSTEAEAQDDMVSMKELYARMAHEEIDSNKALLRKAAYAIGTLAVTTILEGAGLLVPLLLAKIGGDPAGNTTTPL